MQLYASNAKQKSTESRQMGRKLPFQRLPTPAPASSPSPAHAHALWKNYLRLVHGTDGNVEAWAGGYCDVLDVLSWLQKAIRCRHYCCIQVAKE